MAISCKYPFHSFAANFVFIRRLSARHSSALCVFTSWCLFVGVHLFPFNSGPWIFLFWFLCMRCVCVCARLCFLRPRAAHWAIAFPFSYSFRLQFDRNSWIPCTCCVYGMRILGTLRWYLVGICFVCAALAAACCWFAVCARKHNFWSDDDIALLTCVQWKNTDRPSLFLSGISVSTVSYCVSSIYIFLNVAHGINAIMHVHFTDKWQNLCV